MQRGQWSEVTAIASRDLEKARAAAAKLGIAKAYGSYEELLADPEHRRHLQSAAESPARAVDDQGGRARQARALREADRALGGRGAPTPRGPRSHGREDPGSVHGPHAPAVAGGQGPGARAAASARCDRCSARSATPIATRRTSATGPEFGGGALMDIGCYLVNTSRFIFGREPLRVTGAIQRDPDMGTDRLTSMLLDYGTGHAAGTCSTQMVFYQQLQIFGTDRPHRDADSVQRAARSAVRASSSTPARTSSAAASRTSTSTPATSTRSRATCFSQGDPRRHATCPSRSKTP